MAAGETARYAVVLVRIIAASIAPGHHRLHTGSLGSLLPQPSPSPVPAPAVTQGYCSSWRQWDRATIHDALAHASAAAAQALRAAPAPSGGSSGGACGGNWAEAVKPFERDHALKSSGKSKFQFTDADAIAASPLLGPIAAPGDGSAPAAAAAGAAKPVQGFSLTSADPNTPLQCQSPGVHAACDFASGILPKVSADELPLLTDMLDRRGPGLLMLRALLGGMQSQPFVLDS